MQASPRKPNVMEHKRSKIAMLLAATLLASASLHAAPIGFWLNLLAYDSSSQQPVGDIEGNLAYFFVVGKNGTTSIESITERLDAGESVASYSLGHAAVQNAQVQSSGKALNPSSLDAGRYSSFALLFNAKSEADIHGGSKYVVLSGSYMDQTIRKSTTVATFMHLQAGQVALNAENWKTVGSVPEPTSGILALIGVAALALRRKRMA